MDVIDLIYHLKSSVQANIIEAHWNFLVPIKKGFDMSVLRNFVCKFCICLIFSFTFVLPAFSGDSSRSTSLVTKILYGVSDVPYLQVAVTKKPFEKIAHVSRAINLISGSQCKYSVEFLVASDDELAGVAGKWRYDIDFSSAEVQAGIANNAYEALSWDPMMFLYPSQKAEARRHTVSKIVRVMLKTTGPKFFCATNLTKKTPPYCTSLKYFEIDPSVISTSALLEAAKNLRAHPGKG